MIDIVVTIPEVFLSVVAALIVPLYYALQDPVSTPREIASYVLLALAGTGYLLIQGTNVFDPTGAGFVAFMGAGALGLMLVTAVQRVGAAFPHTTTTARR